jgi:cytochrome oxidase assembly protein ShyY1
MPDEEFDVQHRFKPYYMIGQIDHSKEILIPKVRIIDGQKIHGYDVINPIYTYENGKISMKKTFAEEECPATVERAAIIVNRGWVPAQLKDKRSRPYEMNTRKLQKIRGVWRKGKNLHQYKYPNNPDNNEWHNMQLEDIGLFWDLSNFDQCKHYYF